MKTPKSLDQFKEDIYNTIGPRENTNYVGRSNLKVQMFEVNKSSAFPTPKGYSPWKRFDDTPHWLISSNGKDYIVMNNTNDRIRILYSLSKVDVFKTALKSLFKNSFGVDNCWFSYKQLEKIQKEKGWTKRGIGFRFKDALSPEGIPSKLSIKAWYNDNMAMDKLLAMVEEEFSVSSVRWKDSGETISSEWYSDGRATFHYSEDVDEVLHSIISASTTYYDSLVHATKIRDSEIGSFEFNFKQNVRVNEYVKAAEKGKGDLKLWMTKVESYDDFKRLQGVDLHTWDRIFLDIAKDYAYMTVPGDGCVNAVPRLVNVQGETVFGKTEIMYNGNEVFV